MKKINGLLLIIFMSQLGFSQEIDSTLMINLQENLNTIGEKVTLDLISWDSSPSNDKQIKRKINTITNFLITNPQIKIELGSHSDCRGDSDSNKKLTIKRAEVIRKLIISDGVNEAQIIAKGYGEERPKIDCKRNQCTANQHEKNNRFEITFLSSSVKIEDE